MGGEQPGVAVLNLREPSEELDPLARHDPARWWSESVVAAAEAYISNEWSAEEPPKGLCFN